MTTAPLEEQVVPTATAEATAIDPYRYGWRYVKRTLAEGPPIIEMAPLTLGDLLHPEEGDVVIQNDLHQRLCTYLYDALRAQVAHEPSAVVLSDVRIAWDVPGLRPTVPDVSVIAGVHERSDWSTFDVVLEGVRPSLIIEVTSPTTRSLDLADKQDIYDAAGIPLYVIVDIAGRRGQRFPRLLGYHLTDTGYQVLVPDERGWLWLEPVRLWLGVQDNQVVCAGADGSVIGDYVAVSARAEAETQARLEAEARLRELEAELRRLQSLPGSTDAANRSGE